MSNITFNPQWAHPFSAIIAGASGAGKTCFVEKLLKNLDVMVNPTPTHIVWAYGVWQVGYEKWGNKIKFVEGIPNNDDISPNTLLVIDDLMSETNQSITQLFTKDSHHKNISVIYITQNLFFKNKEMRTISLNSNYIILFKNPRDISQTVVLGRQMYCGNTNYFQQAYKDATSKPHGYILCDLKQSTPDNFRLRTNIFPEEHPEVVYIPKSPV